MKLAQSLVRTAILVSVTAVSSSLHSVALASASGSTAHTPGAVATTGKHRPIVYTIAGSDSGGGAGIQADLLAIANFGCHGCSAITCLTAQNSVGVTSVHTPPASFLEEQLRALVNDLPPLAIKIGMLATKELVVTVGAFLKRLRRECREADTSCSSGHQRVWVVLDPVMMSTSGSRLMDEDAQQALIEYIFPFVDIITPNKYEAEALLKGCIKMNTAADVEQAAIDLLQLGCAAVLIKGGHADGDFARDYFLAATTDSAREQRLCDGEAGVWIQSRRYETIHTHGTGCTLSSSMAAALALGEDSRRRSASGGGGGRGGAYMAMDLVDACCLAKAYVTAGIAHGRQLGQGPGPVAHTVFPNSHEYYPTIPLRSKTGSAFVQMKSFASLTTTTTTHNDDGDDDVPPTLGRIMPIVDSVEGVKRLCDSCATTIQDVQLRIKGETNKDRIFEMVQESQALCAAANIRLWINDYWEFAVAAGCYGVHVGQEDLCKCVQTAGGLDALRQSKIAVGISTHTFGELAAALGVNPTYIASRCILIRKDYTWSPSGVLSFHTTYRW